MVQGFDFFQIAWNYSDNEDANHIPNPSGCPVSARFLVTPPIVIFPIAL